MLWVGNIAESPGDVRSRGVYALKKVNGASVTGVIKLRVLASAAPSGRAAP